MNFIKTWFKKIVGWIALPVAKAQDKITELIAPVIALFKTDLKIEWSAKVIGKVILGVALAFVLAAFITAAMILSIVGVTLLLAVVLPVLMANVIAVGLTLYTAYEVLRTAVTLRADEIEVELPVKA